MASSKMNTKAKGKDDKNKINKATNQTTEDQEVVDFALLRKPIHTSVTGFAQARKIFDLATEELKDLLTNECDVLYECKVCRNLFRSLANFISHKRVYCKEKFNSTVHGHFIKNTTTLQELIKIKSIEKGYQDYLKEKKDGEKLDKDTDGRIPITKDLTSIIENITKQKGIAGNKDGVHRVTMQKIPSSEVAVFQNLNFMEGDDQMRSQVEELEDILSKDKAVLQEDGNFKIESSKELDDDLNPDSVIHISDDDDSEVLNPDDLLCRQCDIRFSTRKTLKFHMKYKHLESRLVYPCPDCLEIFSTSWSVYRHLFKVHRKSSAQIRRLRESIQAKAFRMNNPPAFYERRKNTLKQAQPLPITEEERLDRENQAWMDNMESDVAAPRCGGCGRSFERRAALAAHTHTCQPRHRALAQAQARRSKIEIQIRKDYNKTPRPIPAIPPDRDCENKQVLEVNKRSLLKVPIQEDSNVEDKKIEEEKKLEEEQKLEEEPMILDDESSDDKISIAESPEKDDDSEISSKVNLPEVPVIKPKFRLRFAEQAEKSNVTALDQKIRNKAELDVKNITCKKCEIKSKNFEELYDHMANHYKWVRYGCKLCNHKHYEFDKITEHIKVVHRLKGDTDFYTSTIKAIDGTEALEISEATENDNVDESPNSRRPSRCSSDSSRLSDESTNSGRVDGSRKRKSGNARAHPRKRRAAIYNDNDEESKDGELQIDKVINVIFADKDGPATIKTFEENSSDFDDTDEKVAKKVAAFGEKVSAPMRRPVRKRTKPKNEDFEYDLSNLLKMEATNYRDAQNQLSAKPTQIKKKVLQETLTNLEVSKDCIGALMTLSRKSIEKAQAHMRVDLNIYNSLKEITPTKVVYPFIKPLPRLQSKSTEKNSLLKDLNEIDKNVVKNLTGRDSKSNSPTKIEKDLSEADSKATTNVKIISDIKNKKHSPNETVQDSAEDSKVTKSEKVTNEPDDSQTNLQNVGLTKGLEVTDTIPNGDAAQDNVTVKEEPIAAPSADMTEAIIHPKPVKPGISLPNAGIPIKLRRMMKNPLINQNIADFTKSGMKTKILVIKPMHRSNGPSLKFQTIKLKDPSKNSNVENKDQIRYVKIPSVESSQPALPVPPVDKDNDKITEERNMVSEIVNDKNDNIEKDSCNSEAVEAPEINGEDQELITENKSMPVAEDSGSNVLDQVFDSETVVEIES